jgi:hypothetical protein
MVNHLIGCCANGFVKAVHPVQGECRTKMVIVLATQYQKSVDEFGLKTRLQAIAPPLVSVPYKPATILKLSPFIERDWFRLSPLVG